MATEWKINTWWMKTLFILASISGVVNCTLFVVGAIQGLMLAAQTMP